MTSKRNTMKGLLLAGAAALVGWQVWRMLGGWVGRSALPVRAFEPPAPEGGERRAGGRGATLVVFLTSDAGWPGLNTALPKALADAGYPTVAWNSLRYYLAQRSPREAARDLERLLAVEMRRRPFARWAIVGYSHGAGVLPFLVNRLPQARRETLAAFVLLAYPGIGIFRFRPSGWLLRTADDDLPATDEVARMPRVPSLCIAGEGDPIRDCRSIERFGIERRLLPLGHGLAAATDEIAGMVVETLDRGGA